MKINWFSPLPPDPAAAARLTEQIAPFLAQHAEITVWCHERSWNREIEKHVEVRNYDGTRPPWREFNHADLAIFHLGDDAQSYGDIWALSREQPGIVVLHDDSLQNLLTGMVARKRLRSSREYLRMAGQHHGERGRALCEAYLRNAISLEELSARCSLLPAATTNALAVVVHSQRAFDAVVEDESAPISLIPFETDHARYGEALMKLAYQLAALQRNWSARVLARRAGEALHEWCTADEMLGLSPRIAEEISILSEGNE